MIVAVELRLIQLFFNPSLQFSLKLVVEFSLLHHCGSKNLPDVTVNHYALPLE